MSKNESEAQLKASQLAGYRAILVGIQSESLQVEAAYIRHDGALSVRGRVHPVPPGRTVVGEAITALGMTRLRMFSVAALGSALTYARRLGAQMQDDAPQIL